MLGGINWSKIRYCKMRLRSACLRYIAVFSCAEVPTQLLPPTDQQTGIDLGLEAFATLANGTRIGQHGQESPPRQKHQ
jgi:transposase